MLHLFFSAVYGLVLLASLTCAVLVDRPIRALSAAVTDQRPESKQANAVSAPVRRGGMQAIGLWLTLALLVMASACTYNASQLKAVVDAGRVD